MVVASAEALARGRLEAYRAGLEDREAPLLAADEARQMVEHLFGGEP